MHAFMIRNFFERGFMNGGYISTWSTQSLDEQNQRPASFVFSSHIVGKVSHGLVEASTADRASAPMAGCGSSGAAAAPAVGGLQLCRPGASGLGVLPPGAAPCRAAPAAAAAADGIRGRRGGGGGPGLRHAAMAATAAARLRRPRQTHRSRSWGCWSSPSRLARLLFLRGTRHWFQGLRCRSNGSS